MPTLPPIDQPMLDERGIVTERWQEFFTRGRQIPVFGLYFAEDSTDPAITLGYGTWAAYAAGKVLVGYLAADPDFGTLSATGGEKTHALTAAETPNNTDVASDTALTGAGHRMSATHTGSGTAHNNLQPFIVVYIWKRVS